MSDIDRIRRIPERSNSDLAIKQYLKVQPSILKLLAKYGLEANFIDKLSFIEGTDWQADWNEYVIWYPGSKSSNYPQSDRNPLDPKNLHFIAHELTHILDTLVLPKEEYALTPTEFARKMYVHKEPYLSLPREMRAVLEAVRVYKDQGLSDDQIKQNLTQLYSAFEAEKALEIYYEIGERSLVTSLHIGIISYKEI